MRRLLSKMFNFALARNYGLEYNPVQGTEPLAPNGRRARVLDGLEIGVLMHAHDEERECGYWLSAAWHRLILLTGQRPGEVLAMEWGELELGARDGWWTVRMSKNGDPIRAALSPQAVRTLRELAAWARRRHDDRTQHGGTTGAARVFHIRVSGRCSRAQSSAGARGWPRQMVYRDHHMAGTQHNACERIRARTGIADFNPHDLRRTAGTAMAELGVPRFIAERVLTDRTVTSVYDRYSYSSEKMVAVRKLGAFVDRMATRHRTQARHDASSRRDLSDRWMRREGARVGASSAMSSAVHRSPSMYSS